MKVSYLSDGKKIETSISNDDVSFIENEKDNHHIITVKTNKDITLLSAVLEQDYQVNLKDKVFLNGFQAWTYTHESELSYKEMNIYRRLPKFLYNKTGVDRYGDYRYRKYKRGCIHGYELLYVQGQNELYVISNNYKNAYLDIEIDKKNNKFRLSSDVENQRLNKGEEFVIFDYDLYHSYEEGKTAFNKKYPLRNIEKLFGYTSWYNYYQNINEQIILRDLEGLDDRFNLFQIDDGYETFVGDWLDVDKEKFPNGLKPIVDKIHQKGFKAGLWLAPFIAESESKLFKERQDLFKKDKNGKPIKSGIGWSGQYTLDIENEETVKYITKCLKHYVDMGFDFFKLDFLYAINVGQYGSSRARITQKGYELLRSILGDKLILGCGSMPFNSIDNFNYIRVGMDLSLNFNGPFYHLKPCYEIPSTRLTIQNTISRSFMNQRLFGNDPDVFLLRKENNKLSKEQKRAVTIINALFGSVLMSSDDYSTYDEEMKNVLSEALNIFKNATNKEYATKGDVIHIKYMLDNKTYSFDYLANKGVLINERQN